MDLLDSVVSLNELQAPPGKRPEALSGDRKGQHSIRINKIINGRRGITPSTALRLAKFFDTSADLWMNLQLRWDLYRAQREEMHVLSAIRPHSTAA